MRVLLLLLLVSAGISTSAQDKLSTQLQSIIKDTATNFQKIKGPLKVRLMDSVFYSTVAIEGTVKTEMQFTTYTGIYTAYIIDSTSVETANKMFDQWKPRLEKALGRPFKGEKGRPSGPFASYEVKSYVFNHGGLNISLIHSTNIFNSKLHKVWLHFSYRFPPKKSIYDN